MAKITIGFNYYFPALTFLKDEQHDGVPVYWNMKPFCEWILHTKSQRNRPGLSVPLMNQEFADLEWRYDDSSYDSDNDLYYIRLKKLRSSNLPAIAIRGEDSENVSLKDNQFLGEFNLIVFDPKTQRVIVQSNYFGLSQRQINLALTSMRMAWKHSIDETVDEKNPGYVDFEIIPDDEALRSIDNSDIYRKFDIRASDINALSAIQISSSIVKSSATLRIYS